MSLASNDWTALIASRWITMAFAAAGIYSLYSLGLLLSRASIVIPFFAILGTMPLFVVHFPKSRSDTVAASFALIASFLILMLKNKAVARRGLYLFASIAVLLITPKSIDLVAVLGLIFLLGENENSDFKINRFVKIAWLVSPLILVSIFAILTSREVILKTMIYWIDTYRELDLVSVVTWTPTIRAIVTGPVVTLFVGGGLLLGLANVTQLNPRERTFLLVGGVVLFFIFIHSQKYFFFLASRVPFLALGALPGLLRLGRWIDSLSKPDRPTASKLLVASFFISLLLSVGTLRNYSGFYLRYQKAVYLLLGDYLQRADVTHYWDAIGLFPKRNTLFHYPSPGDETNKRIIDYVELSRPSLVLRSSKMELLEPEMISWLASKYIALGDQIFIRYLTLDSTPTCRLEEADLRKALEGQSLKLPLAMFTRTGYGNRWIRVPIRWSGGNQRDSLESMNFAGASIDLANCDRTGAQYAMTESKPWDALPAPLFSQFFGYDGTL